MTRIVHPLPRLSDGWPAVVLLLAGLAGLGAAWMTTGATSGQYLVIAPPGSTLADTITMVRVADGGFVEAGRYRNIIIAGSSRPDFPVAMRRAGAWLVVATPQRGGCVGAIMEDART